MVERRPTLLEQIAELKRELVMRERVYPFQIRKGKLEEHIARHRVDTLAAAIMTLEHVLEEQFAKREGR